MSRPFKPRLYGTPIRLCSEGEMRLYKTDNRFKQMRNGQAKALKQATRDKHRQAFTEEFTHLVSHTSSCDICQFNFVGEFDEYLDHIDLTVNPATYQDPLRRIWGVMYGYCSLGYTIVHGHDAIIQRYNQAVEKGLKSQYDYEKRVEWAMDELKKHVNSCRVCIAKFF